MSVPLAPGLLAGLPERERAAVLGASRERSYGRQQILFHEGDTGNDLYLLTAGSVALRAATPEGLSATYAVLGPGDLFGEMALLSRSHRRTASAVAVEDVAALVVDGERFQSLRRAHPAIESLLVSLLAQRVDRLSRHLLEALYVSVDKRVLRRLLALAGLYGGSRPGTTIPLTQEDLAGLAGTSRPTVNQVLKALETEGALRLARGRIEVVDPAAIAARAR